MAQNLAEHHASVTVNAPVHQVYSLFTHFNDFPKFMSFVKEVTYHDDQRSHWVAEVLGRHEWDATNENWIEDQQIGWRSYNGLENNGRVAFQLAGSNQTRVDVFVNYDPPAGILGDVGEKLGAGSRFENALQHDLNNFARMVDQAPPGALDPQSSNYLFHSGSAAAQGTTTDRQNNTMGDENPALRGTTPGTGYGTTTDRPVMDQGIIREPSNRDYATTDQPDRDVLSRPDSSVTRDPTMPPEDTGTRNPVMPPDRDPNTGF